MEGDKMIDFYIEELRKTLSFLFKKEVSTEYAEEVYKYLMKMVEEGELEGVKIVNVNEMS